MNTLLIIGLILIGALFFLVLGRRKAGYAEYPYQINDGLLSKAERSFYGVLVQAVGDTGLVFAKVRAADVIMPVKGLKRSVWQRAFNAVSLKHFDFVICDPEDCSVRFAVEVDDASHETSKGQKRDNQINAACDSAGLPLLRIKAAKSYVVADIRHQIEALLSPSVLLSGIRPLTDLPEFEIPTRIFADPIKGNTEHYQRPAEKPFAKSAMEKISRVK